MRSHLLQAGAGAQSQKQKISELHRINGVVPSGRPKAQEQVQRPKNMDANVQGQKHEKHACSRRKSQREEAREGERERGKKEL